MHTSHIHTHEKKNEQKYLQRRHTNGQLTVMGEVRKSLLIRKTQIHFFPVTGKPFGEWTPFGEAERKRQEKGRGTTEGGGKGRLIFFKVHKIILKIQTHYGISHHPHQERYSKLKMVGDTEILHTSREDVKQFNNWGQRLKHALLFQRNPSSLPSTHIWWLPPLATLALCALTPSSGFWGHCIHVVHTHRYTSVHIILKTDKELSWDSEITFLETYI